MVTLKLVVPFVALLVAWFAASTYCVCALAKLPANLSSVDISHPVRVAPPTPVSLWVS